MEVTRKKCEREQPTTHPRRYSVRRSVNEFERISHLGIRAKYTGHRSNEILGRVSDHYSAYCPFVTRWILAIWAIKPRMRLSTLSCTRRTLVMDFIHLSFPFGKYWLLSLQVQLFFSREVIRWHTKHLTAFKLVTSVQNADGTVLIMGRLGKDLSSRRRESSL